MKFTPVLHVLLVLVLGVSGCCGPGTRLAGLRPAPASLQNTPGGAWLRTELYFGMNRPGGEVGESEWEEFVREVVTPQFPEGLTVLKASGQWQDPSGRIIYEGSRLLILLHPPSQAAEDRIEWIRKRYCTRFQQESVVRVTAAAYVSFQSSGKRTNR